MDYEVKDIALENSLRADGSRGTLKNEVILQRLLSLGRVDAALERLVDGSFGHCAMCDENIELERLIKDPTLTRCAMCA